MVGVQQKVVVAPLIVEVEFRGQGCQVKLRLSVGKDSPVEGLVQVALTSQCAQATQGPACRCTALADASSVGAKAFERFILSQSGQTLLRDLVGVVPVRLDVTPPGGIGSITQLRIIPADPAWLRAHGEDIKAALVSLLGEE